MKVEIKLNASTSIEFLYIVRKQAKAHRFELVVSISDQSENAYIVDGEQIDKDHAEWQWLERIMEDSYEEFLFIQAVRNGECVELKYAYHRTLLLDEIGDVLTTHSACAKGYVSRKLYGVAQPYAGKYGIGWTIARPRYDSTQFHDVDYIILKYSYSVRAGGEEIGSFNIKRNAITVANRYHRQHKHSLIVRDNRNGDIVHVK